MSSGSPSAIAGILAGITRGRGRYVHISFYFPPSVSPLMASHFIRPVISSAEDWLQYADNCWIVWSPLSPQDWYGKLSLVQELKECSMLFLEIDLSAHNRSGQLPKWVWDWIDKKRDQPGYPNYLAGILSGQKKDP